MNTDTQSVNLHGLVLPVQQANSGQRSKRSFANSGWIRRPLIQNKYAKSTGLEMLAASDCGFSAPLRAACLSLTPGPWGE